MTETADLPANGNALARSEQQPLAHPVPPRQQTMVGQRGLVINSFEDLWRMATAISKSGLAPTSLRSTEQIFVALEMGLEVGMAAMASIRSIAVINGRPAIYGDAALALVRASGYLESFEERIEGNGDGRRAICISKRKGMPSPRVTTFSVADSRAAGLWGKAGPWKQYPDRMLTFRARGFNLRDEFGDVLNGMVTVEEAADIPADGTLARSSPEPDRGVAGLVKRISAKPLSENQVLTDPETDEVIQQGDTITQDGEVVGGAAETQEPANVPDAPEQHVEQADPAPTMTPRDEFFAQVFDLCEANGITDAVKIQGAIQTWAIKVGKKGKEHEATQEQKDALFASVKERRGVFAFAG